MSFLCHCNWNCNCWCAFLQRKRKMDNVLQHCISKVFEKCMRAFCIIAYYIHPAWWFRKKQLNPLNFIVIYWLFNTIIPFQASVIWSNRKIFTCNLNSVSVPNNHIKTYNTHAQVAHYAEIFQLLGIILITRGVSKNKQPPEGSVLHL